ncbi:MAG TPA: helicase-related protein [Xanthobacteraceae bacterium]
MPLSFYSGSRSHTGSRGAGVTAVLGPTNTGKTHLAIERMLGHSSGIIGLPLRLLAREVYNKVCARVGTEAVALVTGEEKIKPANPRYWIATVEAMPRDLDVAFLAVDEVQLGADLDRGHVFTDRMLNRRGRDETLVLGAHTARGMVERLLPGAHVLTRPRLSQLSFAGEKKLTRLLRRSAVVAFSAEEVYSIAELIRRQRGGAAVVLGALSPRTRNAQVELYQSGDVEYLVATDAIGMGLNLDVDHVAFASDRKFDGYQFRRLNPAELAQIAGRAGRATRDGSFGTTGSCPPFEPELAQALESHSFEPIKVMQWRNTALDFSSIGALQASLAEIPKESGLTRAPTAEDILVLDHAARDDDIRGLAKSREAVERLWDVCQVPDYRKISPASHAELAIALYEFLMRDGHIPADWFARQVEQADRVEGDIDTLSTRIAHIRTWTFAANRPDWLQDPEHWQGVTRAIEDKLSDALHERLTERFVDRRTSVLMRRLRENTVLEANISKSGEVVVEGHTIGRLDGLTFTPELSAAGSDAKALAGAAQKALAGEISARATRIAHAADGQLVLSTDDVVRWLGQPIARLIPGEEPLKPRLRLICDEHLEGAPRDAVQSRLDLWLKTHIERILEPLFRLAAAEDITGLARGLAYQLIEAMGVLERHKVAEEMKSLDQPARASLRKYGVRFGAYHIYLPSLLKPAARVLATQLWRMKSAPADTEAVAAVEQAAGSGRTSISVHKDESKPLFRVAGYRLCGERAVRVDILERLADLIRTSLAWRAGSTGEKPPGAIEGFGFTIAPAMTSLVGCSGEEFGSVLRSLGYRMEKRPRAPEPVAAADVDQNNASSEQSTEGVTAETDAAPPAHADGVSEGMQPGSGDGGASAEIKSVPSTEPATAEFIEVWRPGHRHVRSHSAKRRAARSNTESSESSPTDVQAGAAPLVPEHETSPDKERKQKRHRRKHRPERPQIGEPRQDIGKEGKAERSSLKPQIEAAGAAARQPSRERAVRAQKGERPDRDPALRAKYIKGRAGSAAAAQPDPDSPFAKLAKLKEQMEADAKEPR